MFNQLFREISIMDVTTSPHATGKDKQVWAPPLPRISLLHEQALVHTLPLYPNEQKNRERKTPCTRKKHPFHFVAVHPAAGYVEGPVVAAQNQGMQKQTARVIFS